MTDMKHLLSLAQAEAPRTFSLLRELVAIPSPDGGEEAVIRRIQREMEECGFDEVRIDAFGNCIGRLGNGEKAIVFDAHMDTVGAGDPGQWTFDPFHGKEDAGAIYGRGSCDQKAGMAAMIAAGRLLKQIGVPEGVSVYLVGSVLEEDCEGLCWEYLLEDFHRAGVKPAFVVSTEATDLNVYIGHRGRADLSVRVCGRSAHGAMPWLGSNAVEAMSEIIADIQTLKPRLAEDPFLGKGTLNISDIRSEGPSKCAVPDRCEIKIDRRLTLGETPDRAARELESLPAVRKYGAQVQLETFRATTWTGLPVESVCAFPVWKTPPESPLCQNALAAARAVTGEEKTLGRWNFSTNCVSISGRHHIPCIGIGPGGEEQAHAPNEFVSKPQIVQAAAIYAALVLRGV